MATLTITIPDAVVNDVIEALCVRGGWRSQALDGTKATFARAQVTEFIRATYREYKANTAAATAAQAAVVQAQTDTSGVSTT